MAYIKGCIIIYIISNAIVDDLLMIQVRSGRLCTCVDFCCIGLHQRCPYYVSSS